MKKITIPEVGTESQEDGRVFTVYLVKVETDSFDYFIKRRYTEFRKLYETVQFFIKEIVLRYKDVKLPKFPEKKWFGS